jgi:hypothetical protein
MAWRESASPSPRPCPCLRQRRARTTGRESAGQLDPLPDAVVLWRARLPVDGAPWTNSVSSPTIHTLPGDASTPANKTSLKKSLFVGFGLRAMLQAVPSQCSNSVFWLASPVAAN